MTSKLIKLVVAGFASLAFSSCNEEKKETDNEKAKRISRENFERSQESIDKMIEKSEAAKKEPSN